MNRTLSAPTASKFSAKQSPKSHQAPKRKSKKGIAPWPGAPQKERKSWNKKDYMEEFQMTEEQWKICMQR